MSSSTRGRLSLARLRRISGDRTAFSIVSSSLRNTFALILILILNAVLEHGSPKHRNMALEHLVSGLLEYSTNEQGSKSVTKALKEGGKETLDRVITRMCEPAKGCVRLLFASHVFNDLNMTLAAEGP